MATIKTYIAPTEHLRPSDLGYTAQVQLGRRLVQFSSDMAQALKGGGAAASQGILDARKTDELLARLTDETLNGPPAARARSGGGSGGGGGSPKSRAPQQEAARAANALGNMLAPRQVRQDAVDPNLDPNTGQPWVRMHDTTVYGAGAPTGSVIFGGQGLNADPFGLSNANWTNGDPLGVQGQPDPTLPTGGNYQNYGYGTGGETMGGDQYGPPAPTSGGVFDSFVGFVTGATDNAAASSNAEAGYF